MMLASRIARFGAARRSGRLICSVLVLVTAASCSNPAGGDPAPDPEAGVVGEGSVDNPYRIRSAEDLNAVRGGALGHEDWDLADHYKLLADIDLAPYSAGEGWSPIGSASSPFTGSFDGNGHSIRRLRIERAADSQGLFGYLSGEGAIRNLSLEDIDLVSGGSDVGGLVGYMASGSVEGCTASGAVSGADNTGGLLGCMAGGAVEGCRASVAVTSAASNVGGFVGAVSGGTIEASCAEGSVSGGEFVGGFSGKNYPDTYFLGMCYARGNVSGGDFVGGFVGGSRDINDDCYSTGRVTGSTNVGGFVGDLSDGVFIRFGPCFFDSETSGQAGQIIDIYPKSSAEMKTQSTYLDWDFDAIWGIDASRNDGYPYLRWELE
ncbi:MAG TPA: GLUG motif-containing protein [Spirochaetales bacterium]|nr:GLUG motif-containing protein [Spirochaetales bacterium]HRY53884.1 GLUG motif-containing protein [Spirochaetia bacterium]HRZ64255.1 GLUG motif-containing protein [Spirochaetia bacterium]